MKRLRAVLVAAISVAAVLITSPAVAGPDDAIAARVKQALIAAGIPNAADIEIATFNGEVDLSGAVASEHVREEAARVAGVVPGVTSVRNSLAVRQPSSDRDGDGVLTERVRKALIGAGIPNAQKIEIKVFNGEVDLGGTIGSNDDRAAAARVAGEVRGVTAVRNDLVVQNP